jgi:LmbE family N-acetylglucosaminyl deacetylase
VKRFFLLASLVLALALVPSFSNAQFPPAPGTGPGLAETIEAIDSARVTTRILYITAHPDDESAAVLTYLARGLHADVALLSLTRGEGGQNALGPEQAPQLGLIRTQELLAATRGYGVKLYFTRARDFGYSKTPEETEKIWGDQVLEDMVRVIRDFRPNIVINHWGGVHSGHGHHQASGLLTPKAVALAADPSYKFRTSSKMSFFYPAEAPWNPPGGVQVLTLDRSDSPRVYVLPLDEVSPLYGKSWREIGLDAFVNHRTQGIAGFLNSPFLRRQIALAAENGTRVDTATLAQPMVGLLGPEECISEAEFCGDLKNADASIVAAREAVLKFDWPAALGLLQSARTSLHKLIPPCDILHYPWPLKSETIEEAGLVLGRLQKAALLAAGFEGVAEADRSEGVRGETIKVTIRFRCRPGLECPVKAAWYLVPKAPVKEISGDYSTGVTFELPIEPSREEPEIGDELLPTPNPVTDVFVRIGEWSVCSENYRLPVEHIEATSTHLVRVPLRIVPAYTLSVEPDQAIEVLAAQHKPFDIFLRVHSYSTKPAIVSVGLDVPDGFTASAPVQATFTGIGDQYVKLTVTPPAKLAAGNFTLTAYAKRGEEKFSTSLEPLPSMPTILWTEPAQTIVHAFDITVPANLRVGYISAEGEPIPDALKRLGINVELLDTNALAFGDLSKYDTIVVGVRAYELRPELAEANKRLLDYVSASGTLVVQYNRDYIWNKFAPAPYPAKIGSPTPRITDETSPVKFLKPEDPLLNYPNKITQADFLGWVQERGLYFWSDFDPRYTAVLAMNDPGESDLNGGLVYTRYGKGTYIYTGLAFFRELPEGVPGAYRLFVNLLAASRSK